MIGRCLRRIRLPSHPGGEQPDTSDSSTPDLLSGTLAFSDVDLNDTHTASASTDRSGGVVWSGTGTIPFASLAAISIAMTAVVASDSTHTGSGHLTWNFNLPDHYLDFLAAGETLELTYAVGVQDNSGALNGTSSTQQVKIVVTGTNDDPVLGVAPAPVSVDEGTSVDIVGAHVSDLDANDVLTATLEVTHGTLALLGNGDGLTNITYIQDGQGIVRGIEITGSAAAIDAAINSGVRYQPDSGLRERQPVNSGVRWTRNAEPIGRYRHYSKYRPPADQRRQRDCERRQPGRYHADGIRYR